MGGKECSAQVIPSIVPRTRDDKNSQWGQQRDLGSQG